MTVLANSGLQMVALRPCVCSSQRLLTSRLVISGLDLRITSRTKSKSFSHVPRIQPLRQQCTSAPLKFRKVIARAMSEESERRGLSGLAIDLRGMKV